MGKTSQSTKLAATKICKALQWPHIILVRERRCRLTDTVLDEKGFHDTSDKRSHLKPRVVIKLHIRVQGQIGLQADLKFSTKGQDELYIFKSSGDGMIGSSNEKKIIKKVTSY